MSVHARAGDVETQDPEADGHQAEQENHSRDDPTITKKAGATGGNGDHKLEGKRLSYHWMAGMAMTAAKATSAPGRTRHRRAVRQTQPDNLLFPADYLQEARPDTDKIFAKLVIAVRNIAHIIMRY